MLLAPTVSGIRPTREARITPAAPPGMPSAFASLRSRLSGGSCRPISRRERYAWLTPTFLAYACLDHASEHGRIAGIVNMHDQVAVTCPFADRQGDSCCRPSVMPWSRPQHRGGAQGIRHGPAHRATRRTPSGVTSTRCVRPASRACCATPHFSSRLRMSVGARLVRNS